MPALCSALVLAAGLSLSSTLITLVSLGLFISLAIYLYRLSLLPVYPTPMPENISGGLILIALILILRQITAVWAIVQMDVWAGDFWEGLGARFEGGQALLLKGVITLEIITNTYLIVGSAFLLLLFFRTRDIFPRTFMIVLISQEVFMLLDTIGVSLMFDQLVTEDVGMTIAKSFGRWVVITMMILYVMRSGRSQRTFVLPHSSLVNYDDPAFLEDLEEENKKGTF